MVRLSGIAGLLFVVVAVSSALLQGQSPSYAESGATVVEWFAAHSVQYRQGQFLSGLGFLLFYLPFLSGLYAWLHSAERGHGVWSRTALAGGVLFPAAGTAGGLLLTGLAVLGADATPDVARFALAAGSYGIAVSGALSATVMAPASIVVLRHRPCGAWLGWFGAAVALAGIVGSASVIETDATGPFTVVGQLAWLGFFAWAAAVSVCMIRQRA